MWKSLSFAAKQAVWCAQSETQRMGGMTVHPLHLAGGCMMVQAQAWRIIIDTGLDVDIFLEKWNAQGALVRGPRALQGQESCRLKHRA
jgi:hypothetical protein